MFIVIEENPNCQPDERVFSESGPKKPVSKVEAYKPDGQRSWCDVTGVEEGGAFVPASAVRVEDSSDGTAWLVFGGAWGLRFKAAGSNEAWSLTAPAQWGQAFLVLDSSGTSLLP